MGLFTKQTVVQSTTQVTEQKIEVNPEIAVDVAVDLTPIEKVIGVLAEQNKDNQLISKKAIENITESVMAGDILQAQIQLLGQKQALEQKEKELEQQMAYQEKEQGLTREQLAMQEKIRQTAILVSIAIIGLMIIKK